jgi:hypothetical protein
MERSLYQECAMAIQGMRSPMLSLCEVVVLTRSQMLTIAFHEFGHALAAVLTGGKVESISLDPNEGGVTNMRGGKQFFTVRVYRPVHMENE